MTPADLAALDAEGVRECTPEALLAFVRDYRAAHRGRWPMLSDIKDEYGGVWNAMVIAWELRERGLL
jgi:hypothetical protein